MYMNVSWISLFILHSFILIFINTFLYIKYCHLHSSFYYLLRNQLWGRKILLISHIFASMNIWNRLNCGSMVNWKAQKRKCGVTELWGTSFTSCHLGCIAVCMKSLYLEWFEKNLKVKTKQNWFFLKKESLKFYLNNVLYRTLQFFIN